MSSRRQQERRSRATRFLFGFTVPVCIVAAVLFTPGGLFDLHGDAVAEDARLALGEEHVSMEDFLRAVSTLTDTPLVWDPDDKQIRSAKVKGNVTITAPKEDILSVVRALLTFYDLVMTPVGPADHQVQLVMDARRTTSILRLKADFVEIEEFDDLEVLEKKDGYYITTTIKVEHMRDLRNARTALSRVVTGQQIGNVTEVPDARAFVVTDFAPNVVAIYRLLKAMDVKPDSSQVTNDFIALKHALADEVEPILSDLFTGNDRITATRNNTPRRPGRTNNTGTGTVEDDPEPRIIADARTNQIIVYATKSDIAEIRRIVEKIDVPTIIPKSYVHVQKLRHLEAEDTAEVLQSLVDASSLFGTASGTTATGGTGGGRVNRPANAPVDARDEEKPAIVADVKSNSIIIAASESQRRQILQIIEAIDIKKPQVLIEAALIELTLDDAYRLAFELGLADDNGLVNNDEVSGFSFSSFGNLVFADKDGDTFFTDRIPPFVDSDDNAAPSGLVGGIFAFGQVPLIFNINNTVRRTRILQLPSIVAADNEEAVIEVKDEQATTESSTTTGGTTSGGFGGFEEAGTTLQISPHIADQNTLLLNINLQVSAFAGEPRVLANGTVIPADRITRRIITVVTCPNRHTVVLGGLMGRNQTSTVERVPILADVPLVGELFQDTDKRDRETSLFLFVTPTIMNREDFADLDLESCRRKQKADELIGYTEIYNSRFVGCEQTDPATGAVGIQPGCVSGSGSASDRLDRIGVLDATRFHRVSADRLAREREARKNGLVHNSSSSKLPKALRRLNVGGNQSLPANTSRR